MRPYRQTWQAAPMILLALFFLLPPATARAVDICSSNNPDEVPPFLTTGIDPNLLLIIDNSASMYDLAYLDDAKYCYDETYSNTGTYVGYFDPTGWYVYNLSAGGFAPGAFEETCASASYRRGTQGNRQVCITLTGDEAGVTAFAARGNYLNWVMSSKLDIEKEILTGGKHDASGQTLVKETRGCLEKRFVKEVGVQRSGTDAENRRLTVAVRPPRGDEKAGTTDRTTRIEIYPITTSGYNHQPCQDAVENLRTDVTLGTLKPDIDACLGSDAYKGPQTAESAGPSAFNHTIQTCWFIAKQNEPDSITQGDISRVRNDCQTIYEGSGFPKNGPDGSIDPRTISTSASGHICRGDVNVNRDDYISDPEKDLNDFNLDAGYVGHCWDHRLVTWNESNGKMSTLGWVGDNATRDACIKEALERYCLEINVPPVIDPSDQVTGVGDDTSEFWNLPAVLVDAGVLGQLGEPLVVLKGTVGQAAAPTGLLQEFAADLRIGAMIFNRDGSNYECSLPGALGTYACDDATNRDGGRIITPLGKGPDHTQSLVAAINAIVADTWTPLAESIYNAVGYYLQDGTMRLDSADFTIGPDPITAWCQMNNILLITDGASTADQNQAMTSFVNSLNYNLGGGFCPALHGSTYLDDLAYYAYRGLGADQTLNFALPGEVAEGKRRPISTHVVAAGSFREEGTDKCSPNVLLADAAESGGTELYQAENMNELEPRLREAFRNIRAGAAAGSAASVISATRSGEGAVYQAIFWPEKYDPAGNKITWAGEVQALFVDARGRLYEDSNRNRQLDTDDLPVAIFHDPGLGSSRACIGVLEDNICDGEVKDISEVNYLWGANNWLSGLSDTAVLTNRTAGQYLTDASRRYIFTWNDRSGDGLVKPGEVVAFEAGAISNLGEEIYRQFQVGSPAEAQQVINWIRGLDQGGLRNRRLQTAADGQLTWRLGDVVHSTPTVVSRPAEGYHFLYRSPSYAAFANRYNHRRHMIYFGGNDGMLHAVNGGFFNAGQKKFCLTPDCQNEGGAMPLGAEMWAYVPYNLWPHLKCLSESGYGHKYYVDLVPRIFDVQIFNPEDPNHPGGWGTILVGGMRFGGEKTVVDGKIFNSAFFILDITNPEEPPKLLAEMTFPGDEAEMGFTTAVPAMVPMVEEGVSEWYLVLGSGPTNLKGESNQTGRVAVISLRELIKSENPIPFRLPATPPSESGPQVGSFPLTGHANSFVSDLITVDFDLNFLADSVYFGTVSGSFAEGWGGMMYRLVTEKLDLTGAQVASQPHEWAELLPGQTNPLPLIDVGQPVTAAPSVAWDGGNYWVYFGTGRLYNRGDFSDQDTYTYYGIREPRDCSTDRFTWNTVSRKDFDPATLNVVSGQRGLLRVDQIEVRSNINAAAALLECRDGTTTCLPAGVTNFQQLRYYIAGFGCQSEQQGTDGWYREFHTPGERNLGQATLLGGLLTFSAYLPSEDLCRPEGFSDLYALFYQTGTAWHRPVFSRFQEPGGEFVQYQQRIGPGLAITPSLHVGTETGAKAFLQTSTGAIVGIEQPELPFREFRTGRESWREIYRQIFMD